MIAALKFSPFDANSARESAVAWNVIDKLPCSIRLLRVGRAEAAFHEFASFMSGYSTRHRASMAAAI